MNLKAETFTLPHNCPACGVDLLGGEMVPELHKYYKPPYRWSRVIFLYDEPRNRPKGWRCPDCAYEWLKT